MAEGRDPFQVRESGRKARGESRELGWPRHAGARHLTLNTGEGSVRARAMVPRIRGEGRSASRGRDREGRGLAGGGTGRGAPTEGKATTKARFVVDRTRVPTNFAVAEPPGGGGLATAKGVGAGEGVPEGVEGLFFKHFNVVDALRRSTFRTEQMERLWPGAGAVGLLKSVGKDGRLHRTYHSYGRVYRDGVAPSWY